MNDDDDKLFLINVLLLLFDRGDIVDDKGDVVVVVVSVVGVVDVVVLGDG